MTHQNLILTFPDAAIAVIALNRPDAANALSKAMAEELAGVFTGFGKEIRAVILTGQGRHFCAGADLKERKGMDETAWRAQHGAFRAAREALLSCPVPVIAAVNGAAMGGGLELALCCDFIYASREARFALTEVTLGILPGLGGTQTLPRAVGEQRAKELIYTGRRFSAEEALEWNLINKLCDASSLMEDALAAARAIAANAPLSVRAAKRAVNQGIHLELTAAFDCELEHYYPLLATKDRHEGIAAFNEKRKPGFTGE